MSSQIDEIRDRLDIVKLISEYLQLKKAGANYRAPCPFHKEKTPSFFVSPSKQIFKCFGCGASGDIFKFIMQIEGLEFKEALPILAKKAGVELRREPIQQRTERQKLYEICELATKFFEKQLKDSRAGKEAQDYLEKRGITKELSREWRIGYSPNLWRSLSDFLVGKSYKREEIIKAGLSIESENKNATSYDRFRGRIMFPIFDLQNNVIGFGGRVFEKTKPVNKTDTAKYLNTPNTLIYDKSRVLYGLNKSKLDIRKKDSIILVEGYTDVILSSKANVKNIVSSSGTSLTPYQLKILSRYTKNLVLGFDMDIAGEGATKRGIDIAQVLGFDIKILSLPDEKDPADVANENPEKWQEATEKTKSIIDFYFQKAFSKYDENTLEGKKEISKLLLPFFAKIQNKIEESECISRLARELNLKEEVIIEELRKVIEREKRDPYIKEYKEVEEMLPEKEEENLKTRKRKIEERLLMLIIKRPNYAKKEDFGYDFSKKDEEEILKTIKEGKNFSDKLKPFIAELELQFEVEKEKGDIEIEEEIEFCINALNNIKKEEDIKRIVEKLKEAEKVNDRKKINKLLEKIKKTQTQ